MFVQSEKLVEEHSRRIGDIAVYGQESNSTTRRLEMMTEFSEVVTTCILKVALFTRRTS